MFDLLARDTWIVLLIAAAAVLIVLPLQLALCFKARRRLFRLLPTVLLALLSLVFYSMKYVVKDWSALVYAILAVFSGVMFVFSGLAWGIWAISKRIRK